MRWSQRDNFREAPCQTAGFNQQPDIIALVVNVPSLIGNSRAKLVQFQKKAAGAKLLREFSTNLLGAGCMGGKLGRKTLLV